MMWYADASMTDWQRGTDSAVAASLALLQEAAQTLEHPPAPSSPYCSSDTEWSKQGPRCRVSSSMLRWLAQTHPHSEKLQIALHYNLNSNSDTANQGIHQCKQLRHILAILHSQKLHSIA